MQEGVSQGRMAEQKHVVRLLQIDGCVGDRRGEHIIAIGDIPQTYRQHLT